jgi:hypothetical protein
MEHLADTEEVGAVAVEGVGGARFNLDVLEGVFVLVFGEFDHVLGEGVGHVVGAGVVEVLYLEA